jgi:hypothetical protein
MNGFIVVNFFTKLYAMRPNDTGKKGILVNYLVIRQKAKGKRQKAKGK